MPSLHLPVTLPTSVHTRSPPSLPPKLRKSGQESEEKAGERYGESIKIKPDFYEGHLTLGQQQFEQAKLSWCYALGTKTDSHESTSSKILELYNKSEENMERGMQMWEESEERRLNGLSVSDEHKSELVNLGLEGVIKDVSSDEASEQAVNIRSQIYILWGTLLYERSVVEWKLGLPSWEECLEVSIEKFELAGASSTDITVIIKNHCSNGAALEGTLNLDIRTEKTEIPSRGLHMRALNGVEVTTVKNWTKAASKKKHETTIANRKLFGPKWHISNKHRTIHTILSSYVEILHKSILA